MGSRRKAGPDQGTKQRLFAASGGYCQNPICNVPLFRETGTEVIHIAEMAHVFAANNDGPRPPGKLTIAERGTFDNMIVLCSSCHTEVDKSEQNYPVELLRKWKVLHQSAIQKIFCAVKFSTRLKVREEIEPLLAENRYLFQELNPDMPYGNHPGSEVAAKWQSVMKQKILPNNQRILALLDVNRDHLRPEEKQVLEHFRIHVDDLCVRHLTEFAPPDQVRFPPGMAIMMMEI